MNGILLAGGRGTRLFPLTHAISKQLLPIYNKPMVFYPLSLLMLAGIRKILIITTPVDADRFKCLLGDGSQLGCTFLYAVQETAGGVAESLLIGEEFFCSEPVTLVLGDNLFFGHRLGEALRKAIESNPDALVFGYEVDDPGEFGVIDSLDGEVLAIEEKPRVPKSSLVATGLYVYGPEAVSRARELSRSSRGELEITDLNNSFIADGKLRLFELERGYAWFDCGSFESLLEASNFIRAIEVRQGRRIGCLEEIAYNNGWISQKELGLLAAETLDIQLKSYLARFL